MGKKIIIRENSLNNLLNEERRIVIQEALGQDFDFKLFTRLENQREMFRYAKEHLGEPEGYGSSRVVFQLNDCLCMKLALTNAGIAQNREEYERANPKIEILTRIHYRDPYFRFIICEYALPLDDDDFEVVAGINEWDFSTFAHNAVFLKKRIGLKYIDVDKFKEQLFHGPKIFRQVFDYVMNTNEDNGDFSQYDNLGLVNRGYGAQIVILDSGFSDEISDKYYD